MVVNMGDLKRYVLAFENLKRGGGGKYASRPNTRFRAPHKPLLLLCVLDLIGEGLIQKNLIELGPVLVERFNAYWSLVLTPADRTSIAIPFFHLSSEGFWHLVPRRGNKHFVAQQRYTPSISQLQDALIGAKLDHELYTLIRNPNTRDSLRKTLIETHFDSAVHEQLFAQGTGNAHSFSERVATLEAVRRKPTDIATIETGVGLAEAGDRYSHPAPARSHFFQLLSETFQQFVEGVARFSYRVKERVSQEEMVESRTATVVDRAFDVHAQLVLNEVARRLLPDLADPSRTVSSHVWRDSAYVGKAKGRVITWRGWRTRLDRVPSPFYTLYLDKVDNSLPVEERMALFGPAFSEAIDGHEAYVVMFVTRLSPKMRSEIENAGFVPREMPHGLHACTVKGLSTFLDEPVATWANEGVALLELQRRLLGEPEAAWPEVGQAVQQTQEVQQTEEQPPRSIPNSLDDFLVWATSVTENESVSSSVRALGSEPEDSMPGPHDVTIAELLDRWIRRYLPDRERNLVEGRFLLYRPGSGEAELLSDYQAYDGWQQDLFENALHVLREQRQDVADLFELLDRLLSERPGGLSSNVLETVLKQHDVTLGNLQPKGLLALLAELNEAWTFHNTDVGTLTIRDTSSGHSQLLPTEGTMEQESETRSDSQDQLPGPVPAIPQPHETSATLELFRQWMLKLLSRQEREIIARRYGLFSKPEELSSVASRYQEPEEKIRILERGALRELKNHRQDLEPMFAILEQALDERGGVLLAQTLLDLPEFAPASRVGLLPGGLLSLLAALRDDWRFYDVNRGTLVTFRKREDLAHPVLTEQTEWTLDGKEEEQPVAVEVSVGEEDVAEASEEKAVREPGPDYDVLHEDDESPEPANLPATNIDFAGTITEVLENARQWNRDLDTDEGKARWGRRLVTYFVYEPSSGTFAPSKFCAYVARQPEPGPLLVAQYVKIEHSTPIFDGHQACEHLTGKLAMKLVAVEPDSALGLRFQQWAQAHEGSIKVHTNGPKLLLSANEIVNDYVSRVNSILDTQSSDDRAEQEKLAPARETRRRKVRETGPLWVTPAPRSIQPAINRNSPLFPIEMELRERLHRVNFIGELAIERGQFDDWCKLVQREAVRASRVRPKLVPPALFVTLMVLTARYSEEDARRFWQPYARMVWGLGKASQVFQGQCRAYFRQAIEYLVTEYELVFPQRSDGDLVRPVYRHAIIPAYLERDFVTWLKSRWKDVLEVPAEHLVVHLREEHSLRSLPPTLSRFISEPDTGTAAADLIRNMAFAASLYAEGQSLDFIGQLLADNPIERSLWEEFVAGIGEQESKARRRPQAHLEWVWSLDTAELMLRLRNAVLHTNSTPDLAVWVETNTRSQDLAHAKIYSRLDPWKLKEGVWLVDELLFTEDGPLTGKVILLGDDDSVLWQQEIPPLPQGPAQFFRLTQQRIYAVPVDNNSLQPGDHVLACEKGITLDGIEAEVALAEEPLTLPYRLKNRFALAGIYHVSLPLTVRFEQQTVVEVATASTGLAAEPPSIRGQNPILGLSPRVPPAFSDRNIWLLLPGTSKRILDRTSLWVRSQAGSFRRYNLRELDVEVDDETSTYWVPLNDLLDEAGGYYTLELRQGLRSLLPAPLDLVHVPGLECVPPTMVPPDRPVYTPVTPPTARIRGVELTQIGNLSQVEAAPGEDDWLLITWHELRGDCRLLLRVNEQSIPLAWPIRRFNAWTEPEANDGVFTLEELEQAVIQAAGSRDVVSYFFVGIPGQIGKQRIDLNAQGQFSAPIRLHGLYDMIRHETGPRVQIDVTVFSESWPLLVVRRPAESETEITAQIPVSLSHSSVVAEQAVAPSPTVADPQVTREALAQLIADMGDSEPTAKDLWSLASAPIAALTRFDAGRLKDAWLPLDQLVRVHDVTAWKERYGLLPAWAVTGRPLYFKLNRGTIVVYPEAALQRGRYCIGYANLRFIHNSLARVYVSWKPSEGTETEVKVRLGMPPQTPSGSYLNVDELNLEAVFQCKVCGLFMSYRQWRTRHHTHAGDKYPNTVDFLNSPDDKPILVQIGPTSLGTKLRFLHPPSNALDNEVVPDGLRRRHGDHRFGLQETNPITAAAHRQACLAWLQRYWEMPGARAHLANLFSNPRWQEAVSRLEEYLNSGSATVPPAGVAMTRLLNECHPREERSVFGLDRNSLLLGYLARHAAHDPVGAELLRHQIGIDTTFLGQLLFDVDIYAPELLEWALTWSELFFVHSLT